MLFKRTTRFRLENGFAKDPKRFEASSIDKHRESVSKLVYEKMYTEVRDGKANPIGSYGLSCRLSPFSTERCLTGTITVYATSSVATGQTKLPFMDR